MEREDILLAGLAAAGENAPFSPVQVQKLFFLIDQEASLVLEGPHFNFEPYDYGPFDRSVYDGIELLATKGLARVEATGRYRVYALTQEGFREGSGRLKTLPEGVQQYLSEIARWVRSLTFEQLVASIYNRYPAMKANSVFRG